MDRPVFVQERPPSVRDEDTNKVASVFAALFASEFVKMFSSKYCAMLAKESRSVSVQEVCRNQPWGQGRVEHGNCGQ